jgi:D-apionolactonase
MNLGNSLKYFAEALPEGIKQTGRSERDPAELFLKAGKLNMIYSNGSIRYISAGSNELIRMIYSALRDKDWLTIVPLIKDQKIEKNENSFRISFSCLYKNGEISLSADYVIEGREDNSIVFTLEGTALESFEKNRIGFCVLHPIDGCAGTNCLIAHNDGSLEQSFFPEEISPDQVFRDIKSMKWISNRVHCGLDFEGDIFETEDQRNWTDASYKTYSTPLSVPFPVTMEKGTRIYQKISFNTEGTFNVPGDAGEKITVKLFHEESLRLPSIGICQSSRSHPMTLSETKIIRSLRFDHYRVDLHLYKSGWQFKAEQGSRESIDLGCKLELALFFDHNINQEINNFIDWYSRRRLPVASIMLFHKSIPSTPDNLAREIIPILRRVNPIVKIATGTNANFAQLNRNRPGETGNDSICYSIHPQEHASDNLTLIENLEAQKYSIQSAQRFAGKKGIVVSPVNIQRRFNANKTFIEIQHSGPETTPRIDCRLMSLFGACWTAISLKYLCENGSESITFYETTGESGIFQGELDSQWPEQFPAVKGMIFPVFHVFRFLLGNKDLKLIKSKSSKPLVIDCLALTDGKKARIILVNFTGSVRTLQLECCSGLFRIRTLSVISFSEAALNFRWTGIENEKTIKSHNDFELEPYSINFIEGWRKH